MAAFRTYYPDHGDIAHLNFSPSAGREMTGPHYALIITDREYARVTGYALACPITSHPRGWPFELAVPKGLLPLKAGEVLESVILTDAVRQIDFRERSAALVAKAPTELVAAVLARIAALVHIST